MPKGRAQETAKCVYCQAFGATKTITHRDDCIHMQAKAWVKVDPRPIGSVRLLMIFGLSKRGMCID